LRIIQLQCDLCSTDKLYGFLLWLEIVFFKRQKDKWLCELFRTVYNFFYTDLIVIFENQNVTSAQHCASSSLVLTETGEQTTGKQNELGPV